MDDPEVIGPVARRRRACRWMRFLPPRRTPESKAELADLTAAAVARKVYGAPTMFVGDEMFFGKDLLDDLKVGIWKQPGPV